MSSRRRVTVASLPPAARRPPQVWTMSVLCSVSSLCLLLSVLHPMSRRTPVVLDMWLGVVSLLTALLVWSRPGRWCLRLAVTVTITGITALVAAAATDAGETATAGCYVWVALYASFFFSRTAARACTLACVGCFAAALAVNPFPGAVNVWVLTCLTMVTATEAIARVVRILERQAITDPLTGLLNREGLHAAAERELALARRSGRPLTTVLIDLDGFKLVNDLQGHAAGDRLLAELAASWSPAIRSTDVLARYGGDEFVLLLPDTDSDGADELLGRLQQLSRADWSFGRVTGATGSLETLLLEADAALYRAKTARDRLVDDGRGVPAARPGADDDDHHGADAQRPGTPEGARPVPEDQR